MHRGHLTELEVGSMKTHRITDGASLDALIKRIAEYEPTQKQLDEFDEAMRKGPPVRPTGAKLKPKKKKPNYAEINKSFEKYCRDHGYIVQ